TNASIAAWPPPLRSPPPSRIVRLIGFAGFSGPTVLAAAAEEPLFGAPQADNRAAESVTTATLATVFRAVDFRIPPRFVMDDPSLATRCAGKCRPPGERRTGFVGNKPFISCDG